MEDFGRIIINWVVGTLSVAIAASVVIVGLSVITLASLKMFNGMMRYLSAEIHKAKVTAKVALKEVR